jgi:hypothetical protein
MENMGRGERRYSQFQAPELNVKKPVLDTGTTLRVGHCQVSPKGECGNWLKNGMPLAPSGQFSGGVLQLVIPPNYSIHHPRMNGYFGNHFGAILNLKV